MHACMLISTRFRHNELINVREEILQTLVLFKKQLASENKISRYVFIQVCTNYMQFIYLVMGYDSIAVTDEVASC